MSLSATLPSIPNWRQDILVMGRPQAAMESAKELLEALGEQPGALVRKQGFPGLRMMPLRQPSDGFKEGIWLPHALFACDVETMSVFSKDYLEEGFKEETFMLANAPSVEWLRTRIEHQDVLVHVIHRWDTSGLKHPPRSALVTLQRFNPPSFSNRLVVRDYDIDDIRRQYDYQDVWKKEWKLSSNRESFLNHEIAESHLSEQQAWLRSLALDEAFSQAGPQQARAPRL